MREQGAAAVKAGAKSAVGLKRKKPVNWMRTTFILSFLIVPTINFLVFYVFVNFSSIVMAFQQVRGGETVWTFNNFEIFFQEFGKETSTIRIAFVNTAKSFLINEIMFAVGFFVSYFIYKKILFRRTFRMLFFLPGLLAGTIVSSFYMQVMSFDGPAAPLLQSLLKLDYKPALLSDSRYANTAIFLNMIWLGFPGNLIIWGGAFSRIPESVVESARLDGANWIQEATRIIIPIVWPTFAMLFILTIVGFFGASGPVFLLTKGELGTMTVSAWLYLQVYDNIGNINASNAYNLMSAIGLLMTGATMIVVIITRTITNKFFGDVQY